MKKLKSSNKKLLAILLAVTLIVGTVPIGIFSAFAAEKYSFTVVGKEIDSDATGTAAIKGASVTVTKTAVNGTETEIFADNSKTATTDADGTVDFVALDNYLEANPTAEISVTLNVTATDYQDVQDAIVTVSAESKPEDRTITMISNPSVTVTKNRDDNVINLYKGTITDVKKAIENNKTDNILLKNEAKVPVGSTVTAQVVGNDNDGNYTLHKVTPDPSESADNFYSFDVNNSKLNINFDYQHVTVTITATITGKGKISYIDSENKNIDVNNGGYIKVDKTEKETIISFIPEDEYHLEYFEYNGKSQEVQDNKYTIKNDSIKKDSDNTIKAEFKINTSKISVASNNKELGTVICKTEKGEVIDENQAIAVGSTVTCEVSNVKKGYIISQVLVNNEPIEIEPTADEFSFKVKNEKSNIVKVIFKKVDIDTFKDSTVDKVFDFTYKGENHYHSENSENYYIGKNTTVSITNKSSIDGVSVKPNKMSLYSTKDNVLYSKYDKKNEDNEFKPLYVNKQVLFVNNVYLVPGSIKIIKDTTAPIVTEQPDDSYNNENKSISFKVSDSESGVNNVTVWRSYRDEQGKDVKEQVHCSKKDGKDEEYSFYFKTVDNWTCDVTYTITAVDNVGNDSTKTITIKNDTQAPYLKNTDNKTTDAVEFKTANNNVFAHILNKISRGSWFGEKMIVTVKAKDDGVGFVKDNEKGTVSIKLVHEGKEVGDTNNIESSANFNKDGTASVEFDGLTNFKGSVYYRLSDGLGNTTQVEKKDLDGNTITEDGYKLLTTANSKFGTNDDSTILLESDAPEISITDSAMTTDVSYYLDSNEEHIYNGDVKFKIALSDKDKSNSNSNIISGLYSYEVKINGIKIISESDLADVIDKDRVKELLTKKLSVNTKDIKANDNGSYKIDVEAIDYAGNVSNNSKTVYVDKTAPIIGTDDFTFSSDISHGTLYGDDVEVTDYGFYFKKPVTVTVKAHDKKSEQEFVSGVKSISVYLVDKDGTKYTLDKKGELIKMVANDQPAVVAVDDNDTISFKIRAEFKGQIYARSTDNVNNTSLYTNPDGTVVERTEKHKQTSSIEFTAPKAQGTQNNTYKYRYTGKAEKDADMDYDTSADVPLYNKDITFGVKASDTYSGIKSVTYTVFEGNKKTSQTASFDNAAKFENGTSAGWKITEKDKNLVTEITNKIKISGNYNNMVLLVELTDRAGNKSYDYYAFGIDKTAPTITVSYDNNNSDNASGTGDYFSADRTATVLVKERNFNTENVKFTLKNAEGDTPKIIDKGIVNKDKSGNGDENVYKYVIKYNRDGVYSFDVSYTDRAKNKASVKYGKSVAPKSFILDKTAPTISVAYDNNQAANGKFFKSNRTATITINEHNFDVRRVTVTQTHTLSGQSRDIPAVSWSGSGDTHIGTIHYNTDGDYTFDITMTDKAGNKEAAVNYGNSAAAKDFTVDTDYQNLIKIDGVKNGDVFGKGKDDSYSAKITVNDVNLDDYNVTLTRSRVIVDGETEYDAKSSNSSNNKQTGVKDSTKSSSETNEPVTAMFVKNASGTSNGTATITIPKRDKDGRKNDGLYTLTVTAKDKATNAKSENLTFSVNRFGSVFTFSDDLNALITSNDGYTQNVTSNDITVYEYNADPAEANTVELISNNDSKKLVNGKDYTRSEEKGVASWYKYSYKISKSNFADDGSYSIRVSSKDSADNISQTSDYPVCSATFYKDSTDPVITSVNYSIMPENNMGKDDVATVNAQDLDITMTIDDAVRLDTVQVYVNEGEADAETYTYTYNSDNKSGNKNTFSDANTLTINNIKIKGTNELKNIFNKDELKQTIKVVAKDKAGNEISTDNKNKFNPGYSFFDVITVSTNPVVRFVSDTTKFWITIASVVAAAVVIAVFVVLAKRKKRSLD